MNPSETTTAAEPADSDERRVDTLLQHYGTSHTHPVNELIHFVAIPVIMLSIIGLLFALHPAVAIGLALVSMVYYQRLSWPFTACMAIIFSVMLAVVDALQAQGVLVPVCVGIFVVAWIFQFIGENRYLPERLPAHTPDNNSFTFVDVGALFNKSNLILAHLHARH